RRHRGEEGLRRQVLGRLRVTTPVQQVAVDLLQAVVVQRPDADVDGPFAHTPIVARRARFLTPIARNSTPASLAIRRSRYGCAMATVAVLGAGNIGATLAGKW